MAERKAILRWFETGLRPEQADDDLPDPRHDPARIPGRIPRINAMALFVDDVLAGEEELVLDDAGLELLPNADAVDVDLFDRFG